MDSGTGDRGVSEVVGFILVFGMLVTAFTVYQGIVVPDQNRQAEFEHNQDVQGQLQNLRNAIVSTAATGSGQAVSVTLGASYPRRAIARNLGVSAGSLQTTDPGSIRIGNVRALNAETADHVRGSVGPFPTKSITYTPVYSFYSEAPDTVYENSIAYNRFDAANLTITDQVVVDGRRITLIAINGSLSEAQQETVSVSTEAISTSSNRVAVTNASTGPINVTVPTTLSRSKWLDALEGERVGNGGYVVDVYDVPGRDAVNVSLQAGITYELRMAKVGVGDATRNEKPVYVTDIAGKETSVPENGTQKLVVEVRDRFNNPVSNVSVEASIEESAGASEYFETPVTMTTDSDGRADFVYAAPEDVDMTQRARINVSFGSTPPSETRTVEFDVRVLDSDGSGGGTGGGGGDNGGDVEEINPADSGSDDVILVSAEELRFTNSRLVRLEFNNTASSARTLDTARISFYYPDQSGDAATSGEFGFFGGDGSVEVGGGFEDVSGTIDPGNDALYLWFSPNGVNAGGDFFILSIRYNEAPETNTYFVAIED